MCSDFFIFTKNDILWPPGHAKTHMMSYGSNETHTGHGTQWDTGETKDTGDTVDTRDTGGDTRATENTGDTGNTRNTGDTENTRDTGDKRGSRSHLKLKAPYTHLSIKMLSFQYLLIRALFGNICSRQDVPRTRKLSRGAFSVS